MFLEIIIAEIGYTGKVRVVEDLQTISGLDCLRQAALTWLYQ